MRAIWAAILDMPRRIHGGLADPIRRRNLFWRIVEGYVGGLAAVLLWGTFWTAETDWLRWYEPALDMLASWKLYAGALAAPLAEFLVYEFVLEPLGVAGHYWERGPRDGETFRYW